MTSALSGKKIGQSARGGADHAWFTSYLLSNISGGIISPLIPLFVVLYLHSNVEYVGIVSALSSAASVPALIFWGNLSDKLKRRKIFVVIGFVGSFLSLLLIIVSKTLGMYILTLVIFQFVAVASTPVATLLILESTVEKKWPNVMSTFNIFSYIGLIAGLAVGLVLMSVYANISYSLLPYLYLVAAFIYLAAGISAIFLLPEPVRKLQRNTGALASIFSLRTTEKIRYFPNYMIHIISSRKNNGTSKLAQRTKIYIFYTGFLMFAFQLFFVPFPVFMIDKLRGTQDEIFIMYLLNDFASAIAFLFSGRLLNSIGIAKTLSIALFSRVGILFSAMVLALFFGSLSFSLYLGIAIYAIMGLFWSFISISWSTSISKLALPENRGKAIGYYNSFLGIGQIISGVTAGLLALYFGYSITFALAAITVLSGAALLIRFQYRMKDIITNSQTKRVGSV